MMREKKTREDFLNWGRGDPQRGDGTGREVGRVTKSQTPRPANHRGGEGRRGGGKGSGMRERERKEGE